VLTSRNDALRSGVNAAETTWNPGNLSASSFGKLASYPVDGYVYAQPLYMSNLTLPDGTVHNVVFVATEHDSVYAFDADGNVGNIAAPLWQDSFIDPAHGVTTVSSNDVGSTDITPEIGITGTPVIDSSTSTSTLYVVAKTREVDASGVVHFVQRLHALDVTSGAEKLGGPVVIGDTSQNSDGSFTFWAGPSVTGNGDGSVGGTVTFNALRQQTRPGLLLDGGVVYIGFASHGDNGPYHGWVLGYNASTLQITAAFNTTPNGGLGGIWMSGNGLASDASGDIYFITGNGTFDTTLDPATGLPQNADYGDSVVRVTLDPSSSQGNQNGNPNGWGLKVVDYFTPSDQDSLNQYDVDFGSGGAVLLPDQPGPNPHLLLAAGKEGTVYLINRENMGHFDPNANHVVQQLPSAIGGLWGSPAFFNGTVYYGGVGDVIKAFAMQSDGTLNPTPTSTSPEGFGYPGPTPSVSSDRTSGGIAWALDNTAYGSQGAAVLYAYDAGNLGSELYNSGQMGARDQSAGAVKFTVPTVANGKVYVGGEFALTIYGSIVDVTVPTAPALVEATALSDNSINLSWSDNTPNETTFTIERSLDGKSYAAIGTVNADVTTFTDTGLTPRTKYYYEVFASNAAGDSKPTSPATATTLARSLPISWNDADIGGPTYPGSVSYDHGVFTVDASGYDIWNNFDQLHYVYQTLGGDGTIVARVDSVQYTDYWAKAGVMMRQSLDADSPYAFMFVSPGAATNFQYRVAQGNYSGWNGNLGAYAPEWVKLVRTGDVMTGYASPDGTNWSAVGSITVPMSAQIYVGLALTAHNSAAVNESTFDFVSVVQATPHLTAIDSGGGPVGTYRADAYASGGNTADFGAVPIDLSGVTDPAPQGVYQTVRYGQFAYSIPGLVPGALYTVRLHFAEDYWNSAGQRIFNVAINGTQVLSNFDVFAATGAQDKAIVEQFAGRADASGRIRIAYAPSAGSPDQNAESSGIEIIPVKFSDRLLAQPADVAATAGQAFSGVLATFVDSSPGGLASDYIATTNWGDGSVTTSQVVPDSSGSGFDIQDTHVFAHSGSFNIKITIQSYDGAGVQLVERAVVSAAAAPARTATVLTGLIGAGPLPSPSVPGRHHSTSSRVSSSVVARTIDPLAGISVRRQLVTGIGTKALDRLVRSLLSW
jgi:hypothetical protein